MKINRLAKKTLTALVVAVLVVSIFTVTTPVAAQTEAKTIVFDYSHGQHSSSVEYLDEYLDGNLTALGYEVVWATGGLNASILANADALVIGAVYNALFTTAEITAISDWFNAGGKFMWVGGDSDYGGNTYINNNMTLILEAVNSHVYLEPTSVEDSVSCCGSGYRAVANGTSTDAFVADAVVGIDAVLMHGPTLLYGSNADTGTAAASPVALETVEIADVFPLLYYGAGAVVTDGDIVDPIAHDDGDVGAFVAVTYEANAGLANTGALVVSGASPYGDYRPMYADAYYDVDLDGHTFVLQLISFGLAMPMAPSTVTMLMIVAIGAVAVVIIVVLVMKKR
ncbi:MAG: hypothetical protein ACTSUO_06870 [Candidatus Thorarchaeota archaeon]